MRMGNSRIEVGGVLGLVNGLGHNTYRPFFILMRVAGMPAGKDSNPLATRGRILMLVPALAGGFCYPCPSDRVSADTRARGQNCHP
jgi:hypothetical protein